MTPAFIAVCLFILLIIFILCSFFFDKIGGLVMKIIQNFFPDNDSDNNPGNDANEDKS